MTDYTELKRLAEAARSSGADLSDLHIDTERMYTAEYSLIQLYEAATPAVVLALIAENEALRKERYARHPFKLLHEPAIGFTGCVICGMYTDHGGLACPKTRATADAATGKAGQP